MPGVWTSGCWIRPGGWWEILRAIAIRGRIRVPAKVFAKVSEAEIFGASGVQTMPDQYAVSTGGDGDAR